MLLLALLCRAWGDDGTVPDEQIVVEADREVELRREAVIQRLRLLGYRMGRRGRSYTSYEPRHITKSDRWKPSVRLYDEGFVVLEGGAKKHAGLAKRTQVVEGIEPEMRAWRVAVQVLALEHRLWVELPAELDAIWHDHTMPPHMRRAAVLACWTSRTCTPEGQAVRDAIRTYIVEEVQTSAWPVTDEEAAQASRENQCDAVLTLGR